MVRTVWVVGLAALAFGACLSAPTPADVDSDASLNGDAPPTIDATPSINTNAVLLAASSSGRVSVADGLQSGLDVPGDFTLEVWIRFTELPPADGAIYTIISKDDNGSNERSYALYVRRTGGAYALEVDLHGPGNEAGGRDMVRWAWPGVAATQWYHVAITFDVSESSATDELSLYIDGSEITENETELANADLTGLDDSNTPLSLGAWLVNDVPENFFDGALDEVRIWSIVRTQNDINATRLVELVGDENGLQGYWRFNGDLTGSSPNTNDLSLTGGVSFTGDGDLPF